MAELPSDGPRRRAGTASAGSTNPHSHHTDYFDRIRPTFPARDSFRSPSSIRIRRLPSNSQIPTSRPLSRQSHDSSDAVLGANEAEDEVADHAVDGRRRSSSAPQRYIDFANPHHPSDLSRQTTFRASQPEPHMQTISEGDAWGAGGAYKRTESGARQVASTPSALEANRSGAYRRQRSYTLDTARPGEYESDVVGLLDLIDPEVRTIGTLTNVQNSLFVPDLGGLINRRPTYDLTPRPLTVEIVPRPRSRAGTRTSVRRPRLGVGGSPTAATKTEQDDDDIELSTPRRTISLDSRMSESRYAVLPHGISLEDWTDEDIEELNDHVRHMLHSRREGFKRNWKGFKKYISKPLGLFIFAYAVLVTLFGAAWVFCLIGWIYVGSRQDYFINVIDNVLVALFALIGDGLAPFRIVDTYHMCFIAHYHHLTWRLRKEQNLPKLTDENDLPSSNRRSVEEEADEVDREETAERSVLTPRQQARLQYHQAKFSKTHTFYKPHETATHHAFPLRFLVAVVVLLDCHSLFQVALGTCTWSIDYRVRPQALTATILSLSISCNIAAGVVISIGDKRTRKKEVLDRIFRQGLTETAIRSMQKRRGSEGMRVSLDLDRIADDSKNGSAPPAEPHKLVSHGPGRDADPSLTARTAEDAPSR